MSPNSAAFHPNCCGANECLRQTVNIRFKWPGRKISSKIILKVTKNRNLLHNIISLDITKNVLERLDALVEVKRARVDATNKHDFRMCSSRITFLDGFFLNCLLASVRETRLLPVESACCFKGTKCHRLSATG